MEPHILTALTTVVAAGLTALAQKAAKRYGNSLFIRIERAILRRRKRRK